MEKETDISLTECQGYWMKVKINDAGKVVSDTGCERFIVKMHDGDVVFTGAESLERLAEDMRNACALRKALDVAVEYLDDIRREYLWGASTCRACASSALDKIKTIIKPENE